MCGQKADTAKLALLCDRTNFAWSDELAFHVIDRPLACLRFVLGAADLADFVAGREEGIDHFGIPLSAGAARKISSSFSSAIPLR